MEDFVRKTKGVRDINSLPLSANHELDMVADVKGKIYIKILNRYKELLFDNGTEQWVIDMLNNLEVDVEQLKEDILDIEQSLSGLPMIEDKLNEVETKLTQINALFTQLQTDVNGLDLRTAELEREVVQLALKDQELLDKINNLDVDVNLDVLYSNSVDFGGYDYIGDPNLLESPYYLSKGVLGENLFSTQDWQNRPPFIVGGIAAMKILAEPRTEYIMSTNIPNWADNTTCDLFVFNSDGTPNSRINGVALNKPRKVTTLDDGFVIVAMRDHDISSGSFWIKLEKGNKQTPNIPYYKYVGINIESSTNPNDYHWIPLAKATESVDDRLTKTISTYDTVNALQNNRLTTLESKVVDTAWTNITPISPFTAVKPIQLKLKNGIVYMRGELSDGTGDCFTLPEGFRPPNDGYEYHYLLPGRSTVQTDAAKIYVRPSGLCSIVSKTGTTPILLEPIMFSVT